MTRAELARSSPFSLQEVDETCSMLLRGSRGKILVKSDDSFLTEEDALLVAADLVKAAVELGQPLLFLARVLVEGYEE